jgi:hypothetical protein
MTLKTRKPTGAVPWPCILLEGQEKAGKSWAIAALSASDKVGRTFWIDLSEGAADEYGAIDGADYEIVDHDGTWPDILAQVDEVRAVADKANTDGDKPVVLAIDSMSSEWDMLSRYAEDRARRSKSNRKILAEDPNADINIGTTHWNAATARHRQLMGKLLTFPGIVVLTARGKEVAEMGKDGNPVPGRKAYRVEGQKGIGYDVSVWVRMYRDQPAELIGARSVHVGIVPGVGDTRTLPGFTLERLVFDLLRCDPRKAHVRDTKALDGRDEDETLKDAKARVWDLAQELRWDSDKLVADYKQHHDHEIGAATADQLDEYAAELVQEIEKRAQKASGSEAPA